MGKPSLIGLLKMNKIYKIDSRFYFCLILGVKELIETSKDRNTTEEINIFCKKLAQKYFISEDINCNLSEERILILLKCVGNVIYNKNSNRYFARTSDVFQLINIFQARKQFFDNEIDIPSLLLQNLKKFNHINKKDIFDYYIDNDNFIKNDFPKEVKNLTWFITHNARKEKNHAV